MPCINFIVFDIDRLLASHDLISNNEKLYFLRKSALITAAETEHQVHVGVIELMQLLCSKDYIEIAFFSAGTKERNIEFFDKLLTKALGREKYDLIKNSIIKLHRDDLTSSSEEQTKLMYDRFVLRYRNNKKDISKALTAKGTLNNLIFIDDDSTYVHYRQERNFLCGPKTCVHYEGRDDCFYEYNILSCRFFVRLPFSF